MINQNFLLLGEETERLRFRKLLSTDYELWLPFFKDPLWTKYWKMEPQTPEQLCEQWMDKIFQRYANSPGGMNVLTHKRTGEFIGQCGLLLQTVDQIEELEVAYSIMPQHRGFGYAGEAAKKCIQFAFDSHWRDSIISIIHENNIESQKVAIKNNLILDRHTIYGNNPVRIYRIQRSH